LVISTAKRQQAVQLRQLQFWFCGIVSE